MYAAEVTRLADLIHIKSRDHRYMLLNMETYLVVLESQYYTRRGGESGYVPAGN